VLDAPAHPYTAALRRAADPAEHRLAGIPGQPPDLRRIPPGCAYAPRCPRVVERCRVQAPPLKLVAPGHVAACWRPLA
jgi:oligopeptide/dipeptide ABC transporter ATP-binding protein